MAQSTPQPASDGTRGVRRGRPKIAIDRDRLADTVAELYAEGGDFTLGDVAERLDVSPATLYRSFPAKANLVELVFERSTQDLLDAARAIVEDVGDPYEQLTALIRLMVSASIRLRRFLPVVFGGGFQPPETYRQWLRFNREFESLWAGVVEANMRQGNLRRADPLVTVRLLSGQCIWISRWYRPNDSYDPESIVDACLKLLPDLRRDGSSRDDVGIVGRSTGRPA